MQGVLGVRAAGQSRDYSYIKALDGVRAWAVFIVVGSHLRVLFNIGIDEALLNNSLWAFFNAGFVGVDIFFVLSGFLITRILVSLPRGKDSTVTFWMRRFLRLMPLHLLYVAVLYILTQLPFYPWSHPGYVPMDMAHWLMFIFYMGNIVPAVYTVPPMEFGLLWSLALEEQFYAIWPYFSKRMKIVELWRFACFALVLCVMLRTVAFMFVPGVSIRYFLIFRADTILGGALIALAPLRWPHVWPWLSSKIQALWPLALCVLVASLRQSWRPWQAPAWFDSLNYSMIAISTAILLVRILNGGLMVRVLFENRLLSYVGKVSYGIYIWHIIVCSLTVHYFNQMGVMDGALMFLTVIASLSLSLLAATISYYGFELPFLRLKDRLKYKAVELRERA